MDLIYCYEGLLPNHAGMPPAKSGSTVTESRSKALVWLFDAV